MPQTVVDCFAVFAEWVSEFGAVERRLASSCNCTLILELCARQLRLKRSLWTWSVLWSGVSCCLLLLKYSYTVIGASTTLRMRSNFFFVFLVFCYLTESWEILMKLKFVLSYGWEWLYASKNFIANLKSSLSELGVIYWTRILNILAV